MNITQQALDKIYDIATLKSKYIRISVVGGGCSGFSYKFDVDNKQDDDIELSQYLITDLVSLSILENSTIDYIQDLNGSYFSVKIPEATSYCGCGSSFAI